VAGKIEETKLSDIYVQKFLNIYYAEAPVGKLRFMKPQPRKPWKGETDIDFTLLSYQLNVNL
jgi:carboxylesterase type B